jgi:hypothetical protein
MHQPMIGHPHPGQLKDTLALRLLLLLGARNRFRRHWFDLHDSPFRFKSAAPAGTLPRAQFRTIPPFATASASLRVRLLDFLFTQPSDVAVHCIVRTHDTESPSTPWR